MVRWRDGKVERCSHGDMERWKQSDGEMVKWRDREMER